LRKADRESLGDKAELGLANQRAAAFEFGLPIFYPVRISIEGEAIMAEIYLVTLVGIALAQLSPGPNLLAVAGAALGQGRRTAFFLTLGVASAILIWVTIAAFGLAALLKLYPSLLTGMKLLGGGYLCFLSLRALIAAWRGSDLALRASQVQMTPLGAWRRGLLVNLTNPKSALAWSAITTFLYGSGLSAPQVLGFAPIAFISAMVIYTIYATLFSSRLAKQVYARFARGVEAVFGIAFGALGGKLMADAVGEIAK
jgi:threonine/homoserine/homoserine lactone efflux protein